MLLSNTSAQAHYRPLADTHSAPAATLGLPPAADVLRLLLRGCLGGRQASIDRRLVHAESISQHVGAATALRRHCSAFAIWSVLSLFTDPPPRAASHASVSSDHATRRPEIRWHEPGRISRRYQRPLTVVFAQPNPSPRVILGQVVGALARRRRPEDPSSGEIRHRWEVRLVGRARILQCRPKGR